MIFGDWYFDSFAYGVGRFDKPTPLAPGVAAQPGTRYLRFQPNQEQPAGLVVLFNDETWDDFSRRVATVDLALPAGVVLGSPDDLRAVSNGGS